MSVIYVLLGALLLYLGGEALVRSASFLARAWGVSSIVIGLTVVALGTSSPELFAALIAALTGSPSMALGAVVGSNIANIGLILGLSCLIFPIQATRSFAKREVPLMIASGALLIPFCWYGWFGRVTGIAFFSILVVYMLILVRETKAERKNNHNNGDETTSVNSFQIAQALFGVAVGIGLLVVGAKSLIYGAETIAHAIGIPERIIGLTVVAFGTSLPEMAACVVAALRRESDIVLGNLIGSNIFNSLGVLGTTVAICPIPVDWVAIQIDLFVMLGITFLALPFIATRLKIGRIEGSILLVLYISYVGYLFM